MSDHPELVPGEPSDENGPRLMALTHAQGGMANETVLIDLGRSRPGLVVRLPPLEPTFPDYDLAPQAAVQNAAAAAGVPAPAPAIVVTDTGYVGSPFLVMPQVPGDIPGAAPLFDPYVRDAAPALQRLMHDGLVDTLAGVHAVPWQGTALERDLPGTGVGDAFDRWARYVAWSSEGEPLRALVEALDWCGRHRPPERSTVVLWGDVRLGNLVFDPQRRVRAVLDWDLSALGPPEMDLGWHLGLEFMMEALFGARPPGFPAALDVVDRYERQSGHEVNDLAWHEVFALVRALAINDRHQRITGDPRRLDNPMGDILLARLEVASRSEESR